MNMGAERGRGSRVQAARILAAMALIAAALVLVTRGGTAGADVTSVSGSAFGESVNVTPLNLVNVTSGPLPTVTLPSSGGNVSNSLASVTVPAGTGSVLTAGVLQVSSEGTTGPTGSATSSASVADVNALSSLLTAQLISSTCTSTSSGSTGSTTLAGATLSLPQQQPLTLEASPDPNTTIGPIAGITVILNEQQVSNAPGSSSITVNAVHIILDNSLLGTGDIIIAQSHCDVAGPNVNTTSSSSSSTSSSSTSSSTSTSSSSSTSSSTSTSSSSSTSTSSTTSTSTTSSSSTTSTTKPKPSTTSTTKKPKCNAGRGNGSEIVSGTDCDPGNAGGRNHGGD